MVPQISTTVGIVGAGPAGLMLAHLLHVSGIDAVVIDNRTREDIAHTHRAGILEHGSVNMLVDSGASTRVLTEGHRHDGIDIRIDGVSHPIDFPELVGESVWLYPQNEVFVDLAATRDADGGATYFGVTDTEISGIESDRPTVSFTTAEGERTTLDCRYLVGADGAHGPSRKQIPDTSRTRYFNQYPFAWFGILCEAPPSHEVLIYNRSERGFALISQRNADVQRMYFQCDPEENVDDWSEDRIWSELQARVAGPDGFELKTGPIFEKTVLPFRSFVNEPMSHGSLYLAGDAAHTVPPTGAKGLNLAFADVAVLHTALTRAILDKDASALDAYSDTALRRAWKAQDFSFQMTTMLHNAPGASPFENRRAIGQLTGLLDSVNGRRYLAECYTGWPHD